MRLGFIIPQCYALISVVVYIVVCGVILTKSAVFYSSYYKLFLVSAAVNIMTYCNSLLLVRYPGNSCKGCFLSGIYEQGYFFGLEYLVMGIQYFGFVQFSLSTAASFNRLTAVVYPLRYGKIWKQILIPLVIFLIVGPVFLTYYPLFARAYFLYVPDGDYYLTKSTTTAPLTTGAIFQGICTLINLVLNLVTIGILLKARFQKKSLTSSKKNMIEVRLLIHSLVNFVAELFATILVILLCLTPVTSPFWSDVLSLIPYCSDALTFLSPYILIFCSNELRRILFSQKPKTTPVISVTNSGYTK